MSRKNIYFVTFGYDTVGIVCSDTGTLAIRTVLKEFGFKTALDYKNAYPGSGGTKTNCRKLFKENEMYGTPKGWREHLYSADVWFDWFLESSPSQARHAISHECSIHIKYFMCVFPHLKPVIESFAVARLNKNQMAELWYCIDWSEPNELL